MVAARRPIASVQIPTIYDGEPSHFRPLADTFAAARALLAPPPSERLSGGFAVLREWGPRLAGAMGAVVVIGAALDDIRILLLDLVVEVDDAILGDAG